MPVTNEMLPSTLQVLPEDQRGKKPGWFSAILGLVAIAVVAAAAVIVLTRDDGAEDPLFVLPAPSVGWQLANGEIADPADDVPGTAERFIVRGRLFGVADGDAFVDLRAQTFFPESPLAGASWDEIDRPPIGGADRAYERDDDSITVASLDLNGGWQVVSSPDDLVHVYGLASNDIRDNMIVIAAFTPPEGPHASATSFDMISPDGARFTVETSASNSPLFGVATFAERLEPVDVNGASGWVVTNELVDGTETSVTWSSEDGRTVTVRSTASVAEVIDVAELLQTVSADVWADVFPDAQAD